MSENSDQHTDQQAGLILQRAAELQARAAAEGTSLGELEDAAAEAGIEPALVRQAAAELAAAPDAKALARPTGRSRSERLPVRISYERTVDGNLDGDTRAVALSTIRHHFGSTQEVEFGDRSAVWRSHHGRKVVVSMTATKRGLAIRVAENTEDLKGQIYGGILGGGLGIGVAWIVPVFVAALSAPGYIPFVFAAWMYLLFSIARSSYASKLEDRNEELSALTRQLAEAITEEEEPETG